MEVERLTPYISLAAAVAALSLLVAFAGPVHVERPLIPARAVLATTTLSVVESPTSPSLSFVLPTMEPATEKAVTPVTPPTPLPPKKAVPTVKSPSAPAIVVAATPTPPTPAQTSSSGSPALDVSAMALRLALVNIICFAPPNGTLHSISGSGVVVSPKGVVLTNAHIAQYFLLKHQNISCTIRSGSPAVDKYTASLVYISPQWVNANASVLSQASPSGTGQYDFAFLRVTSSATSAPLPSSFSYVSLATEAPAIGMPVAIASYAAQSLTFSQILSSLFPTVVFGSIKDVFTFAVDSVDVVALGGSAAAQEGSSGGGVADSSGNLTAMLTTSTISGEASARSLDAITISYIMGEYANETGQSVDALLTDPSAVAASFSSEATSLESVITSHLP